MNMKHRVNKLPDGLLVGVLLTLIAALVYLPFIFRFGYYFDDWYIMFAAGARGAEAIREIYSIDRPAGALLMSPLFALFGANPLYYNLSAFAFRVLGALGVWTFCITLWPRERAFSFITSLLFLIYPGFLSQPNGITYQYYLAGLASATWSVAFTMQAVTTPHRSRAWFLHGFSILLGLFYLSQIEWYIGFEAIRWTCIFLLTSRERGSARQKIVRAFQQGFPALLVPALFFAWRIFFFENERGATDVGVQIGDVFLYPLQTLFRWGFSQAQNMFETLVVAWVMPLQQIGLVRDNTHRLIGLAFGGASITMSLVALRRMESQDTVTHADSSNWKSEMMWLGLAALAFGLAPVTLANREVWFPSFSRYTLVASLGAAILIAAWLCGLSKQWMRWGILAIFILASVFTHYGNGSQYATWTQRTRNFWWQVSWRAPQLQKNTTLIANIASVSTEEDYFVWGPANILYYPESQNDKMAQPSLYAAVLNKNTVQKVLIRERQEYDNRRGIITYKNYRNILILSQPSPSSCVHVINGLQPESSTLESDSIRVIGSYSEIEHLLVDEPPHTPPQLVFGPEPPRGWCYFYQSADLARQRGNWESIIRLGNEAQAMGFAPSDLIEWMPFLQAYAITGDADRLAELMPVISAEPYIALQVCRIIGGLQGISDSVVEIIDSQYCPE
ncbi:MAG: hypothetical protein HS124_09985 [Anaerolineales bacterium]|nr:hypothetical protein [Anaerolineales bacterium]MCL4259029.1 hypothetical protein [Anaerolineales bacterium]